MSGQLIEVTIDAGVATLALNRPDKRNAVSDDMRGEMIEALAPAAKDLTQKRGRGYKYLKPRQRIINRARSRVRAKSASSSRTDVMVWVATFSSTAGRATARASASSHAVSALPVELAWVGTRWPSQLRNDMTLVPATWSR